MLSPSRKVHVAAFKAKVLSKTGNAVRLGVWITEPQRSFFGGDQAFALQLVWDAIGARERSKAALGAEISAEHILDAAWLRANAATYIASMEVVRQAKYPASDEATRLTGKAMVAFWSDLNNVPYCEYAIEATRPEWIAHIKKGQTWDSSAIVSHRVSG